MENIDIKSEHITQVKELRELGKKLGMDKKLKNIDTLKALKKVDEAFWPE